MRRRGPKRLAKFCNGTHDFSGARAVVAVWMDTAGVKWTEKECNSCGLGRRIRQATGLRSGSRLVW